MRIAKLGQLHTEPYWLWLNCRNYHRCHHRAPVAVAPFVIRWGPDAPADWLRQRVRCSQCGCKGADIFMPSWGTVYRWQPFPADRIVAW